MRLWKLQRSLYKLCSIIISDASVFTNNTNYELLTNDFEFFYVNPSMTKTLIYYYPLYNYGYIHYLIILSINY